MTNEEKRLRKDAARYRYLKGLAYQASCVEIPWNRPSREVVWWSFNMIPGQDYAAGKLPELDKVIDAARSSGDVGE